jgi:DNA-binding winged helix-turn-helix (wHTH) protein
MLYIFEDYTLDTRRYELRRAVDLVPLDRQVFEVLAYLLAHPDQVVTRQELFTHLWPERCVSDAALERCITIARRALGDNGREQRCIKMVHGRGYRFVAAVATRPDAELRPLALASPLALSPLHMPSAAQPSARTVASEGVWEHKPVAVLAIELTWPTSTEPEALGDAPWQVTTAWQHTLVEQLQAAEFLYETWRLPERAYTFKHALTQEVAYGSLVQSRRRACTRTLSRRWRYWQATGGTIRWNDWRSMPCGARCGRRP